MTYPTLRRSILAAWFIVAFTYTPEDAPYCVLSSDLGFLVFWTLSGIDLSRSRISGYYCSAVYIMSVYPFIPQTFSLAVEEIKHPFYVLKQIVSSYSRSWGM
ncbi:hypothetical protein BDR07DRAFT_216436 [Suillus spraguei]|nr:hypothetical protein BDR07DRAFT_216436 [Suillus spraguei]